MTRNVQFVVRLLQPWNGVVDGSTSVTIETVPLADLQRVALLPVYETLPNREKEISSEDRFEKYLKPYFAGRHRYLTNGQEISIDGVDFKVVATSPGDGGMVTLATDIFSEGDPLRVDDMKQQQMLDDEAMARQLQMQESGPMLISVGRGGGGRRVVRLAVPGAAAAGRPGAGAAGANPDYQQLQQRISTALASMPANSREHVLLTRLHRQLGVIAAGGGNGQGAGVGPMMRMLRQELGNPLGPGGPGGGGHGASQAAISILPTRAFVPRERTPEQAEAQKHLLTCMVCLSEYEKDEILRTLPCFHTYHAECVDRWLIEQNSCPVCKNPINT